MRLLPSQRTSQDREFNPPRGRIKSLFLTTTCLLTISLCYSRPQLGLQRRRIRGKNSPTGFVAGLFPLFAACPVSRSRGRSVLSVSIYSPATPTVAIGWLQCDDANLLSNDSLLKLLWRFIEWMTWGYGDTCFSCERVSDSKQWLVRGQEKNKGSVMAIVVSASNLWFTDRG